MPNSPLQLNECRKTRLLFINLEQFCNVESLLVLSTHQAEIPLANCIIVDKANNIISWLCNGRFLGEGSRQQSNEGIWTQNRITLPICEAGCSVKCATRQHSSTAVSTEREVSDKQGEAGKARFILPVAAQIQQVLKWTWINGVTFKEADLVGNQVQLFNLCATVFKIDCRADLDK